MKACCKELFLVTGMFFFNFSRFCARIYIIVSVFEYERVVTLIKTERTEANGSRQSLDDGKRGITGGRDNIDIVKESLEAVVKYIGDNKLLM